MNQMAGYHLMVEVLREKYFHPDLVERILQEVASDVAGLPLTSADFAAVLEGRLFCDPDWNDEFNVNDVEDADPFESFDDTELPILMLEVSEGRLWVLVSHFGEAGFWFYVTDSEPYFEGDSG